ncbi:UDP-N-acetylmuramoyl-tripeptide--D-alanyl-D-alanine ligase [Bombilactobacillus thymidiniphilus]|uniref:UDP-N-acetylmuramoyl-tripeptide--D-alanyl-D-alanine ligase n=1 Tax=Bombilactobacillus thymidiniphilus TaxID=2923363 RepID=A0ABY4PEU4_9LACO|nr:UDP-N-acetylmuramoyl-tripeptide--D-alanyl-D-alanine ligase [Bombilactobacillus thymidiniphilus]UQS84036.1 UDP-N-acetylmuramoyl-tripeptide--D-alanyl-D-alanine ligase [Bombilactobacillus thymidiniphilus]
MKLKLSQIADMLQLPWNGQSNPQITNITFDSRKIEAGSLFVPLVAQRDGHDFVNAAFKNGAQATLWQKDHSLPADLVGNYLIVDDTLDALQQLSKAYLKQVNPKVVAITGSNGKTTTKDMVAAVLASKYRVVKTQDNFNNELGVPLTILSMSSDTQILVVEMGMDRPGQLLALSALAQPDVAVITMIGEAHIEFFGTRAKIADAKMEIVHSLKEQGVFIYNGDEPLLEQRSQKVRQKKFTFGLQESCDLWAHNVQTYPDHTTFKINAAPDLQFFIPLMGDYNVDNALAALLVGRQFQVSMEQMQSALAVFQPTKNRTQWLKASNGAQLLSDVYNANPTAMIDVINNFSKVPTKGRRILVLGDMLELGEQAPQLHASIVQAISEKSIAEVYLLGDLMKNLQKQLTLPTHYYRADQQAQLIAALKADLQRNDVVLLKASNGLHLDKVVQALQN